MISQATRYISAAALAFALVACSAKPQDASPVPAAIPDAPAEATRPTEAADPAADSNTAAVGTPAAPAR